MEEERCEFKTRLFTGEDVQKDRFLVEINLAPEELEILKEIRDLLKSLKTNNYDPGGKTTRDQEDS